MNRHDTGSLSVTDGPLTLEDVQCWKPSLSIMPDPETKKAVEKFNENLFIRRINWVNKNYKNWLKIWPEGTPLHFFAAINTFKLQPADMEIELKKDKFIGELIDFVGPQADIFKQKFQATNKAVNPKYSPVIDLSPEERLAAIKKSQMPNIDAWPPKYYSKVVKIFQENYDYMDVKIFADSFKWTIEQCKYVYEELKKRNAFEKPQKQKKKAKTKITLTSITFLKDGKAHRLGQFVFDPIDQTQNPLKGYLDPITNLEFHRPMICPYGYVLDYNTWWNRLQQYHLHPYQDVPFTTMQSLTDLTVKNYDEYKDKIRNAPFAKSDN